MALLSELQQILAEFALDHRPMHDVRSWLEDHVDEVMEAVDEHLHQLDGAAWTLISEYDRGDRDEDGVKSELRKLLMPSVEPDSEPVEIR